MRFCPRLRASGVVLAAVLFGRVARADELGDLEAGKALYRQGEYARAVDQFHAMLVGDAKRRPTVTTRELVQLSRMYWGASLFSLRQKDDALVVFRALLRDNYAYEPDPTAFPSEALLLFAQARTRLLEDRVLALQADIAQAEGKVQNREIEAAKLRARIAELEPLANTERHTEHHSRWLGLVPFGVGQFQNGEKWLGFAFLGAEAALAVATTATYTAYRVESTNALDAYQTNDDFRGDQFRARAENLRFANIALASSLVLVAVAGIVQAEVAYKNDVITVVPRKERREGRSRFRPSLTGFSLDF